MKATDYDGDLSAFLTTYRYQPDLTKSLDGLEKSFEQADVNEIVLWKVNRYAQLSRETLRELNGVVDLKPGSHKSASKAVSALLRERGVDLPMASTLLRFRNPRVFQIIDGHAYRAISGADHSAFWGSTIESKVELYFRYLDDLIDLARAKNVDFQALDRMLYEFDKKKNGTLKSHAGRKRPSVNAS